MKNKLNTYLWLSIPIAILVGITAWVGIFQDDFYRDAQSMIDQAKGQDPVNLLLIVPLLLISAYFSRKNSISARALWAGTLVYIAYTYVVFCFSVHFNPLFLAYIAILSLSSLALLGGMLSMDLEQVRESFHNRRYWGIGVFLLVTAAMFYFLWLGEIIPALRSGSVPAGVEQNGLLTSPVHVLDLGFLLPSLVYAAIALWRRSPFGYLLTGVLLTFELEMGIALVAMAGVMTNQGYPDTLPQLIFFSVLTAVSLALLVYYLLQPGKTPAKA